MIHVGRGAAINSWQAAAESVGDYYLQHHVPVDFLFFALLFGALAWTTLKRRFPGRSGRFVSAVVGLALSISLTLSMARRDLSLLDMAIVPVVLLSLFMVLMAVSLVRKHRLGIPTTVGIGLLAIGMVGAPVINAEGLASSTHINAIASALGFLILVRFLHLLVFTGKPPRSRARARVLAAPYPRREDREIEAIRAQTDWALRRNWGMLERLRRLTGLAREPTADEATRRRLEAALNGHAGLEAELGERLKRIRKIARHLEKLDAKAYKSLADLVSRSGARAPRGISDQLVLQHAKLTEEHEISVLTRKAAHHARRINHCLWKAKRCVDEANQAKAERWLDTALKRQEELSIILGKLAKWEKKLERVAEKQALSRPR